MIGARTAGGTGLGLRRRLLETLTGVQTRVPSGVALTFDDGPMPGTTDSVLDVLASLEVTATFFCVGRNAKSHPALVRRIVEEGHAIGSHSFTHASRGSMSSRELVRDYAAGQQAVEDVLGARVILFRPPYGYLSVATAAALLSRRSWTWTVDPADWRPSARVDEVAATVASAVSGDVVLLHDWVEDAGAGAGMDRSATLGALRRAVVRLRARGVRFVRLPLPE